MSKFYEGNLIESLIESVERVDERNQKNEVARISHLTVDEVLNRIARSSMKTVAVIVLFAAFAVGAYRWVNAPVPEVTGTLISTSMGSWEIR